MIGDFNKNPYETLLSHVLHWGVPRPDRTGTGTLSVFGAQLRYDISRSLPLITTKKVHWNSVVGELLWFLSGSTNVRDLQKMGVSIWDEWADENGDLGPIYGHQWRDWGASEHSFGVDQIKNVVESIRKDPFGRRHIVSAWNPQDLGDMALPPCHVLFQFYVHADEHGKPERLSCQLYQRSADLFLGVPFNIASYSLLTYIIAHHTGLTPQDFVWTGGDVHLYKNHVVQAREQITRTPRPYPRAVITVPPKPDFDYSINDFSLIGYHPYPALPAEVAV